MSREGPQELSSATSDSANVASNAPNQNVIWVQRQLRRVIQCHSKC